MPTPEQRISAPPFDKEILAPAVRNVESCPHRQPEDDGGAICGLLERLTGVSDRGLLRVGLDACRACCRAPCPTATRLNAVVASLVDRVAGTAAKAGGLAGCDPARATALCRWARRYLHFEYPDLQEPNEPRQARTPCYYLGEPARGAAFEELDARGDVAYFECRHERHPRTTRDQCHRCRDWADRPRSEPRPLDELLPPPPAAGPPVRSWSVGVTTAPRSRATVDWTIDSLGRAGWPAPRVFADLPVALAERHQRLAITVREPDLGAWPNYYLAIVELLLREPSADAILMVQDDVLFYDRQDLRAYLERSLWPTDPPGIVSLYCSAAYSRDEPGWHAFDGVWVWGGAGVCLSPSAGPPVRRRSRRHGAPLPRVERGPGEYRRRDWRLGRAQWHPGALSVSEPCPAYRRRERALAITARPGLPPRRSLSGRRRAAVRGGQCPGRRGGEAPEALAGERMFYDHVIRGNPLPRGVLSLTYDDGPGPHSIEIGELLASHGIGVTFFVLGKNVQGRQAAIARLKSLGHLIGNHTFGHPRLPDLMADGGDVAAELIRTHELIADPHESGPVFFRAPHGDWNRDGDDGEAVASALNQCPRLHEYVGPIGWDIDGADWRFWREGRSVADCAARTWEKSRWRAAASCSCTTARRSRSTAWATRPWS